jgi:hypothetical protein
MDLTVEVDGITTTVTVKRPTTNQTIPLSIQSVNTTYPDAVPIIDDAHDIMVDANGQPLSGQTLAEEIIYIRDTVAQAHRDRFAAQQRALDALAEIPVVVGEA